MKETVLGSFGGARPIEGQMWLSAFIQFWHFVLFLADPGRFAAQDALQLLPLARPLVAPSSMAFTLVANTLFRL